MDAAAFSTGISIRWSHADRSRHAADPFTDAGGAPVKKAKASEEESASTPAAAAFPRATKEDEESYSACQELAYQYAVEQTKSAVRTVLLKANTNCYHQVLKYFETHMSSSVAAVKDATSATGGENTPSVFDALVDFPEFHGFPTAAIVAGTDATFSEVWVNPLCQVLQRSFPLIFVVKDDFQNARRMVEWMVEQLDGVKKARESEETWLADQIDRFDMLDPTAAEAESEQASGRRATLRARTTESQTTAVILQDGRREMSSKHQRDDDGDGDFVALEDEEESDDDEEGESDGGGWKRVARKKRKRPNGSHNASKSAAAAATRAYSKWTMEQLLLKLQTELELLMGENDQCKMWIATLHDLIDDKLAAETELHEGNLECSLQCYSDAIDWLKKRIFMCRSLPGSQAMASVNVCSTEFSLAQILHETMNKFLAFLEEEIATRAALAAMDPVGGGGDNGDGAIDTQRRKQERELLDRWRRRMSGFLKRHEDYYQLHHYNAAQYEDDPRKPFFLICIEQLEAFNQEVLDDFLVIWTNFSRQLAAAEHRSAASTSLEMGSRMGFIVGVASSASPALRRLNLSIVSQIDMQFFSLEDSRKCFDDILEALIVDTNLPLCLGGDVMRWVAGRHRTTQSITMFIHALEFLFFTHFKHVQWSFLSHFCLEAHWRKPLQSIMTPSKRLVQWMWRNSLRATAMTDYLFLFSDAKVDELRQIVFPDAKAEGDWVDVLQNELASVRQDRTKWAMGWKCFRAACSWLDIELQGDEFISYLASALDGKLANTTKIHLIMQKLETCSLRIAVCLMDDWSAICKSASANGDPEGSPLSRLATLLDELILVCQFAMETQKQPTTQKMLSSLRQEIKNAFSDEVIVGLVHAPRTRLSSAQVLKWLSVTDVQVLEERLHFNYHDKLKELLLEIEDGHAAGTSWVNDVSLAFLYYQESAGIYLSLSDWYETFADAVQEEFQSGAKKQTKTKRRKTPSSSEQEESEVETKARFLRAFCTLRHWGFVKSIGGQNGDTIEKVVFI